MNFFSHEFFEIEILSNERVQIFAVAIAIGIYAARYFASTPMMKSGPLFITTKNLSPKDRIVIGNIIVLLKYFFIKNFCDICYKIMQYILLLDMLNMSASNCCFVVSDPSLTDNPLVYAR